MTNDIGNERAIASRPAVGMALKLRIFDARMYFSGHIHQTSLHVRVRARGYEAPRTCRVRANVIARIRGRIDATPRDATWRATTPWRTRETYKYSARATFSNTRLERAMRNVFQGSRRIPFGDGLFETFPDESADTKV